MRKRSNKKNLIFISIAALEIVVAAAFITVILTLVMKAALTREIEESSNTIVWYQERDLETLVYGHDNGTDFVPGVYTGGSVISPEEDFYNSMELMGRVVEAEAGNQGLQGKRMVVDVILNRVNDKDFPDTIVDVIYQANAFAVISNGMYKQVEISEETWEAIYMELEEISYPGLLYFCSTGYHQYGTPWKKVGDHYFNTK